MRAGFAILPMLAAAVTACQAEVTPEQASANICGDPKTISGMVRWLNSEVGKSGGPAEPVAALQGLAPVGPLHFLGNGGSTVSCHGYLRSVTGRGEYGTLTSYDPGSNAQLHVSWEPDRATALRQAAESQAATKARRAMDWRSYRGDIGSWTGIPPLPASASQSKTATSNVQCAVGDQAYHNVTIWASRQECNEWISEAKELAKSGPTPGQVWSYQIDRCIQRVAQTVVQQNSGEIFEYCASVVPRP